MAETGGNGSAKPQKGEEVAVQMTDGRIVDFVGKRKMIKQSFVTDDGRLGLRIDWRNGETRTFWAEPKLLLKFAGHGFEQKFGDECAGVEDVEDQILACEDLDRRVNGQGQWNVPREAGGISGTSVLLRALVAYKESKGQAVSVEQIKEFLSGKSQAEKMALRTNPAIKPFVEQIEAEKAQKGTKVDNAALQAGLDSLGA